MSKLLEDFLRAAFSVLILAIVFEIVQKDLLYHERSDVDG